MLRRLLLLALLASVAPASHACLNDRDSDALAVQNARLPDALRVVSGRFERNPPRFYEMRIARVKRELRSHPKRFGLYDDLAVAHDRLGDDDAALRVMKQKRALLPPFNKSNKTNSEAWYRYFANDGTFRAHRFLHGGAKVERLGELKRAHDEIKRAIEIKPNAHFGRERVQLRVMEWMLATKRGKANTTLGQWIEEHDGWRIVEEGEGEVIDASPHGPDRVIHAGAKGDTPAQIAAKEERRRECAQGLAGLVVLGAAWQSPDVFEALAHTLDQKETAALSFLALLRCRQLLREGRPSLAGLTPKRVDDDLLDNGSINEPNAATLNDLFPKLRREADAWNASRAAWMEAKFAQGEHPDTHPNFWRGWKEPGPPPSLDVNWFNEEAATGRGIILSVLFLLSLLLGVPVLAIGAFVWWKKRRTPARVA